MPDPAHARLSSTSAGAHPLPGMPGPGANAPRPARMRGPKDRPPQARAYRPFMTVVLLSIVAVVAWADRAASPEIRYAIGSLCIAVWALTLIGSHGVGPVGRLWRSIHR